MTPSPTDLSFSSLQFFFLSFFFLSDLADPGLPVWGFQGLENFKED